MTGREYRPSILLFARTCFHFGGVAGVIVNPSLPPIHLFGRDKVVIERSLLSGHTWWKKTELEWWEGGDAKRWGDDPDIIREEG